jgi:Protein of unknown function, DUF481
MKVKLILLCMVMLVAIPVFARNNTDVILMKNGDRITCKIKGLKSNTLYVSIPYILGTASVDWSNVDHIESKQLFLVKTQNGTVYTGSLSTPETFGKRPTQIEILQAPEEKVTLEKNKIVEVNETARNFWQRLNGQISTGFTYSKGNESAEYNLSSDITYPRERWSAGASYSSNFTSSTGSSSSKRNELVLSGQRLTRWNNWYYIGLADFLQSSVQGIRLQSAFGGGVGRYIKNSGATTFKIHGGLAWQNIDYQRAILAAHAQRVSSGLIGTSLNLFQFDRTTLAVSASFLPAISQPGRVHLNLRSSYYVKLWGKLNWNFTLYDTFDNRPPPGFAGNDYGTTSGISIEFGNR